LNRRNEKFLKNVRRPTTGKSFFIKSKKRAAVTVSFFPVVRNEDRRFLQSSDNTILSPFFEHFSQLLAIF
jgi:hypothetical protein